MKMAGTGALLLGIGALLAVVLVTSAQEMGQPALPYEEELLAVREPMRTMVLAASTLLRQLGVHLALIVASAIKFVVMLLHVIGSALGKETELVGPIRELEAVFSRISAASPDEAKGILAVLVHKIAELLKCVLTTVHHLLGALLHPGSGHPSHHSGLLSLVHSLL